MATGESTATGGSFERDWEAVRASGDIQFAPLQQPKAETPDWLSDILQAIGEMLRPLAELIGGLGLSATGVAWAAGIAGAAALLYLIARLIADGRLARRTGEQATEHWTPPAAQARRLLQEADRLAAEGRFGEAAHLLLLRSVEQIAESRPGALQPSATAREIASLPALPAAARAAFTTIAQRVERSLFALQSLSAEDWQVARAAYAGFALPDPVPPTEQAPG